MRFFPFPTVAAPAADSAPFQVEHSQIPEAGGHFTPTARLLMVTPALRTGGLLAQIPDEAARTLLAMLACLTPNGRIQPSTMELAEVLGTTEAEARARLTCLAAQRWQGQSIAHEIISPTGRITGVLAGHVVTAQDAQAAQDAPPETAGDDPARLRSSGREAVIAHSRATYGRPRDEVEREVAEQLGHAGEEEDNGTPEGVVRKKLRAYGIPAEEAQFLVATYPLERIERQIAWMGMRRALHPARFLRAAILHDYEPPEYVRRQKDTQYEREEAREEGREQEPQEPQAVDPIETVKAPVETIETVETAVGDGLDAD